MNTKTQRTGKMMTAILAMVLVLTLGIGSTAAMPGATIDNTNETSHLLDGRFHPEVAPQINYFFAEAPSEQDKVHGVRYWLNYQIDYATRAEIFGNELENASQGRFAIYGEGDEPNKWVVWARNDVAWIEAGIEVDPTKHTSAAQLLPVTVDNANTTIAVRHPDYVDGDRINLFVNGAIVLNNYQLQGWHTVIPVQLQSNVNYVTVQIVSEGQVHGAVTELTIGNVVNGQSTQVTQLLRPGQMETMQIWVR